MADSTIPKLRFKSNLLHSLVFLILIIMIFTTIYSSYSNPNIISEVVIDGVIGADEYSKAQNIDDDDFILYWQVDQNTIYFAMEVLSTGWVSIGLDPSNRMLDADMYFGWVSDNGTVGMIDAYSIGEIGPHPPDTELGGTDDILEFNGTEVEGKTIIEFKRGIVTADTDYDNNIPLVGEIPIIWAYGTTDNFLDQHAGVSRGTIFWSLEGASVLKYDFSQPLILALAFLVTLTGLLIYVDSRGRPPKNQSKEEYGEN
jgi:hypothetical protein